MNVGSLQRLLCTTLVRRSLTQLKDICNFPNHTGLLSFSTLHSTTLLNKAGLGKAQLQLLKRPYSDEPINHSDKTENSSEPVNNLDSGEPINYSDTTENVSEPVNICDTDEPVIYGDKTENNCETVNNCDEVENTSDKVVLTQDNKPSTEVEVPDILYRAIDIFVKGHELAALESYMEFCTLAANELGITVRDTLTPKFIADRSTLLKSKHIYKKHRVQYEIRTHKKVLQIKFLTGTTADVYLEYIQRNLPAGVAMHVHKFELERIPEHIREEMKKNLSKLTEEDWEFESKMMKKCRKDRFRRISEYQEHATTKRFLLGKVS